jgi:hypothetical protein
VGLGRLKGGIKQNAYKINTIGVHPSKSLIVDVQKVSMKVSNGLAYRAQFSVEPLQITWQSRTGTGGGTIFEISTDP